MEWLEPAMNEFRTRECNEVEKMCNFTERCGVLIRVGIQCIVGCSCTHERGVRAGGMDFRMEIIRENEVRLFERVISELRSFVWRESIFVY